jgi:sec-independent protein translocase protein TatA
MRCFKLRELFTPGHILLIVLVALLLFGPAKLPELGRGFGKMLREFKSGVKGITSDDGDIPDDKHVSPKETAYVPQYVEVKPSSPEARRLP